MGIVQEPAPTENKLLSGSEFKKILLSEMKSESEVVCKARNSISEILTILLRLMS